MTLTLIKAPSSELFLSFIKIPGLDKNKKSFWIETLLMVFYGWKTGYITGIFPKIFSK